MLNPYMRCKALKG